MPLASTAVHLENTTPQSPDSRLFSRALCSCCLSFLPTLTHLQSLHLYHLEYMDEDWMRVLPRLTQLRDLDLGHAPESLLPGLARLSSLQVCFQW